MSIPSKTVHDGGEDVRDRFYWLKYLSVCMCNVSSIENNMTFIFVEEITAAFRRFGPLVVDWPHKAESKSYFPPKGNDMDMTTNCKKRKKKGGWGGGSKTNGYCCRQ